ncbi:MAG: hypothetical protein KC493_07700 [Bacteriovoracaceae bacterium]|nr:hypothetical protein [Bacteriovoracaceae bacterium]
MHSTNLIEIDFCNRETGEDPFTLTWELSSNVGAALWLKLLRKCIFDQVEMRGRFSGFTQGPRDWKFLGERINKCVEIINDADIDYQIEERFSEPFNQDYSNKIHHHFEVLIGPCWDKTELFRNTTDKVRDAICGLNEYIHEMEVLERAEINDFDHRFHAAFAVFHWVKGITIPDICNEEFTLDYKWGDIVLNYAQIGKTWLEVYLDEDEEIFPEAILPLRQLTGSFDIFFGEMHDHEKVHQEILDLIQKSGGDPNDSRNRIGYLPVAHLVQPRGISKEEIISKITSRLRFKSMRYIKNEKIEFETKFNKPYELVNL